MVVSPSNQTLLLSIRPSIPSSFRPSCQSHYPFPTKNGPKKKAEEKRKQHVCCVGKRSKSQLSKVKPRQVFASPVCLSVYLWASVRLSVAVSLQKKFPKWNLLSLLAKGEEDRRARDHGLSPAQKERRRRWWCRK